MHREYMKHEGSLEFCVELCEYGDELSSFVKGNFL